MPQLIFIVIALIIKLAVEGTKEMNKSGTRKTDYSERFRNLNSRNNDTNRVHSRPSISEVVNKQRTTTPVYGSTTSSHQEEFDSDDYDDFTEVDVQEVEAQEAFVEETVKRVTTYEMRANKIKFMIFMLVYCMWEDDNDFTKKEKRMFKMISRVASVNLNRKDTDEIKSFMDIRPNLDAVVRKQQEYQLDVNDVIETISNLRKHLKNKDEYSSILSRIERRFQYEL